MKIFREKLVLFKKNIKEMINILNSISENMDNYYKIIYDLLNNYNLRQRNYEILKNINSIRNFIQLEDIDKIIDEDNDNEIIFKSLLNILKKKNINNKSLQKELNLLTDNNKKYINVNFYYQGQFTFLCLTDDTMFIEAVERFCQKLGIDLYKLKFYFNNCELRLDSSKSLSELGIKNMSTIEVISGGQVIG